MPSFLPSVLLRKYIHILFWDKRIQHHLSPTITSSVSEMGAYFDDTKSIVNTGPAQHQPSVFRTPHSPQHTITTGWSKPSVSGWRAAEAVSVLWRDRFPATGRPPSLSSVIDLCWAGLVCLINDGDIHKIFYAFHPFKSRRKNFLVNESIPTFSKVACSSSSWNFQVFVTGNANPLY